MKTLDCNILVTGGAGYIGSHTCKALANSGFTPVVYDSLLRGNSSAVKWGALEVGDLKDVERLRDVMRRYRPAGVIHFAALAYVGESMQSPLIYYDNNVGGSVSLLRAMAKEGVKHLVFSSTCATYGVPEVNPIREDMPQNPINPYGRSKLMVEQILKDSMKEELISAVALRYFNAAGADAEGQIGENHEPETHLIPLAFKAVQGTTPPLTVFGRDHPTSDGTCIRDYIHVTDLADAHVRALEYTFNNQGFSAFNLGTGKGNSIMELLKAAKDVTGREIPFSVGPRRAGDPAELVADPSLALKVLGWRPQHSNLGNILQTAWAWMQRE